MELKICLQDFLNKIKKECWKIGIPDKTNNNHSITNPVLHFSTIPKLLKTQQSQIDITTLKERGFLHLI